MGSPPPVCGNGVVEKGEVCDGTLGCNMSKHEMCVNCTKCVQMPYCGDGKCETWEDKLDFNGPREFICGVGELELEMPNGTKVKTCSLPLRKICSKDCGCPSYIADWDWNESSQKCQWTPANGKCQTAEYDCRDCPCADGWSCRPDLPMPGPGPTVTSYSCYNTGGCGDGKCLKPPEKTCVYYYGGEAWPICCQDCGCQFNGYYCLNNTNNPSGKSCRPKCGDGTCAKVTAIQILESLGLGKPFLEQNISEECMWEELWPEVKLKSESPATCCQDCGCECPKQECIKLLDASPDEDKQTHACVNCKELMIISGADYNGYADKILKFDAKKDVQCLDKCNYLPDSRIFVNNANDVLTALESFCSKCKGSGTGLGNLVLMGHGEAGINPDGSCAPPGRIAFPGDFLNTDWLINNEERLKNLRGCFAPGASLNIISCFIGETDIPPILSDIWPGVKVYAGNGPIGCTTDGVCVPQDYVCIYYNGGVSVIPGGFGNCPSIPLLGGKPQMQCTAP